MTKEERLEVLRLMHQNIKAEKKRQEDWSRSSAYNIEKRNEFFEAEPITIKEINYDLTAFESPKSYDADKRRERYLKDNQDE